MWVGNFVAQVTSQLQFEAKFDHSLISEVGETDRDPALARWLHRSTWFRMPERSGWQCALDDLYGSPDVFKYNVAINSCKKAQQWQLAVRLLLDLQGTRFQPDVLAFTSALSACQSVAEWQQALSLFAEFSSQKMQGNLITFTSVISACSTAVKWQDALHLLKHLDGKDYTLIYGSHDSWRIGTFSRFSCIQSWLFSLNTKATRCWKLHWNLGVFNSLNSEQLMASNISIGWVCQIILNFDILACSQQFSSCQTLTSTDFATQDLITYNAALGACSRWRWCETLLLLEELERDHLQCGMTVVLSGWTSNA